jgi:prefoldin subunit 4
MSNPKALRPANAEDVTVTWADQQNINKFGRLHTRLLDLSDELAQKKTECEALKDASTEIDNLLDDDACKIKIGEIFFEVSNDDALAYANEYNDKKKKEYAALIKEQVCHLFSS